MYTRQQYLTNECTHRQYYGQFVTPSTKALVKRSIGIERLRASTDEHFNDIPLHLWDQIVPKAPGSAEFSKVGDFYTQAGGVCLLKEAARQLIEE